MPLALSIVIALLAIAVSASNIACSPEVEKEREKDAPAGEHAEGKSKRTAILPSSTDYKRVARLFGESLLAGNYPAAYDLTSSRLHSRMSLEKFTEACTQAAQQYGEALQLGPIFTERVDGLAGSSASQQYGFPAEIPDDDRLAWLHCALALDIDGDEILRCYDCWMLLENDGGKARIGHFNFTPCE